MKKNEKNILQVTTLLLLATITILFSIPHTYATTVNNQEYLKLEIDQSIEFQIEKENNFRITTFTVDSYFLPQSINDAQYLNDFTTNQEPYEILNESNSMYLRFPYTEKTLEEENKIINKFTLESTIQRPKITSKAPYPIQDIPSDYDKYLEFSGLIDINEKIKAQSSQLAQGEDDTFEISMKIAQWIANDINYDLATLSENPNQKSTEVFESKKGVCKEITHLYISMLRSLGIPARVATGYAYTNSEEVVEYVGSNWGGHAWAEVLIDGQWVPFDLTYDQYGYVDASHIILDRNYQIRNQSVLIQSSGYGIKFKDQIKIDTDINILDQKERITSNNLYISISGLEEIGFNSYGYIQIDLENKDNFYKSYPIKLSKVNEIDLLDDQKQFVLLKPNEKKTIYFRYKLNGDFERNKIYTLPFTIYNNDFEETFEVKSQYNFKNYQEDILPQYESEEKIISNFHPKLNCTFESAPLPSSPNTINCQITNPNNYEIADFRICLNAKTNCQETKLKINEKKEYNFTTTAYQANVTIFFNNESEKVQIEAPKSILKLTTKKAIYDTLYLSFEIENYKSISIVEIYSNNTLIITYATQADSLEIPLNEGENIIELKLIENRQTIETQKLLINAPPKSTIKDINKTSNNFFEKIINWFKSIFQ